MGRQEGQAASVACASASWTFRGELSVVQTILQIKDRIPEIRDVEPTLCQVAVLLHGIPTATALRLWSYIPSTGRSLSASSGDCTMTYK